eukprot:1943417-Amphidinium_carterae.2
MALGTAQLLDTKALTKPPRFSGNDEDWSESRCEWSFQFLGYVGLVSQLIHKMRIVARITYFLHSIDLLVVESLSTQSRSLHFLLTQSSGGKRGKGARMIAYLVVKALYGLRQAPSFGPERVARRNAGRDQIRGVG